MRVPMSWLKAMIDLPEGTATSDVAALITEHTAAVERIEVIGGEVSGPVVVGRVVSAEPQPQKNGKTIMWCRVDVGAELNAQGHAKNADGADAGRGIVCGAHNFAVGDLVVVALPGAELPGGFAISARKTYGHMSDGMICASDELGTGTDHTGIIVLPESIDGRPLDPGEDARQILGIPEDVLEIDVTPDIGYCMSIRGIARELAQVMGIHFSDPYREAPVGPVEGPVQVRIDDPACSQFVALPVTGLDPRATTPSYIADRVARAGMRPINLAVDVTNYVMIESGQPLHAYDQDKVSGAIVVRRAAEGEHLVTLDDTDRTLDPDDLLITDDSGPIGLAGVMGGAATEMTGESTSIILEGAHFEGTAVARSYRRHRLGSEASRRFERGVDPVCAHTAVIRAAELLKLHGGARIGTPTIVGEVAAMPQCHISSDLPGRILGIPVTREKVIEILSASRVQVTALGDTLSLVPPTWRPDLVDPYDYVEEVGRKLGFDQIEPAEPPVTAGTGLTAAQRGRRAALAAVAGAGFVEVISLPFIGDAELDAMGLPPDDDRRRTVALANPLDDTRRYLRTSLLPGLFQAVTRNLSRSQDDLALFECGTIFLSTGSAPAPRPSVEHRPSDEELDAISASLPDQPRMLAGVLTGDWRPQGWRGEARAADWTHAVMLATEAAAAVGLRLERRSEQRAPWHPGRCAGLVVEGELIGCAGELHPQVCKAAGLPARSCAVELDLDALLAAAPHTGEISQLSGFPVAKEDVALVVEESVPSESVRQALILGAGPLLESVELFDVYTGSQVGQGHKSLAFNLRLRALDRTLTDADAARARDAAVGEATRQFGAELRS
ncbi:phenylalanine--tRNA ligase subunit beta [Acidipropionibacterium virtanenii]|uniref:Phenylalanine--tRNA ligase beta subunit n=1 Tax=Acidipropionibacterium virtanenii TaxID=2057246 RepID=A0A344UVZ2_9ACTN|nr:phenylalanine--tRNA ligase subunit beta [Acidipropionibacterium virtanenii]AXE39440.1 Phenylalanine--tRNA ligase beta subunit [Acidipropionibacterium virtanenii]